MMNAGGMNRTPGNEPSHAPTVHRGSFTRLWPLFVTLWLVFIVPGPVATLLAPPLSSSRMLMALAWTAAFGAAYLWLMLYKPFREAELTGTERRVQIGLLLILSFLVLVVDVAYPTGFFWLFIFVLMAAGVVLPTRAAVWTIISITLLAAGVEAARGEWSQVVAVPGIAMWGVCTIILRRLVATVDELRAAREELASFAVAEERLRFARDLHDLLGHTLSLIALKSELAGRLLPQQTERARAEIADIERTARQALREVRETVAGYRRPRLVAELAGARELLTAAGIESQIDCASGPFPPEIDEALAWTVREGTTNVIRHSHARHCEIRIANEDGAIRAEVVDDGRGAPASAPSSAPGAGLPGLVERVAEAGGRLEAGSVPGGGFRLQVHLPRGDECRMATTPESSVRGVERQ
jgi:two-component system, NarL family, sensor histidine kinase DesK